VDDISFEVRREETVCLVGEALSILGLVETPPGEIAGGRIIFEGQNLMDMNEEEMEKIRGKRIAMVFQEPLTSLNPVFTIEDQIGEAINTHHDIEGEELHKSCVQLLKNVGISSPEQRLKDYPHQFSGGQRQRIMIAMALSCDPDISTGPDLTIIRVYSKNTIHVHFVHHP
jgi:ABC-type dipeptide/oligopeptide/nickel transport system ATPase component